MGTAEKTAMAMKPCCRGGHKTGRVRQMKRGASEPRAEKGRRLAAPQRALVLSISMRFFPSDFAPNLSVPQDDVQPRVGTRIHRLHKIMECLGVRDGSPCSLKLHRQIFVGNNADGRTCCDAVAFPV